MLPCRALRELPALQNLPCYDRLFTPLVTLWYLLFQRLNADHTLDAAVADARAGGANRLQRGLSRRLLSDSSASYSDARQRLPLPFLAQVLRLQGQKILGLSPTALWKGFRLALLDGTTVRLRPHGDIPKHFTPHSNQHYRRTYWCLMRVVVVFCGCTGAALDCAMGSCHLSEQTLAAQLIARACEPYLFIGDRNFGVFRILQAAGSMQHHLLLRLTKSRAAKLLAKALREGDYALTWAPSPADQLDPALSSQPLCGRLIVVSVKRPGFRPQWLYLFTTLTDAQHYPINELVILYGRRWHVELNLRSLKTQLNANQLEVHSAPMAQKEWLAALLAYNLVRAAMLCAALPKALSPLSLSFSQSRRRLEYWLRHFGSHTQTVLVTWKQTLELISRCRLPCRKKPRPPEPRAQRHRPKRFPPLIGSRARARKKLLPQPAKS